MRKRHMFDFVVEYQIPIRSFHSCMYVSVKLVAPGNSMIQITEKNLSYIFLS